MRHVTERGERGSNGSGLARWTIRLGGAGLLLVTAAGFLGSEYWRFDVIANVRFQLLGLATVGLIAATALRDRWAGGTILLAVVLNAVALAPLFIGYQPPAAAGVEPLRVMTFNLFEDNRSNTQVLQALDAADADVIFLEELSQPMRQAIEAGLADYTFAQAANPRRRSETAALVRDGLATSTDVLSVSRFEQFPIVHLQYGGANVDLIGIHPLSPLNRGRTAARDRALEQVAAWAVSRPGEVVVAGDFNATPFSYGYRRFAEQSGLRSTIDGAGWQPTWPNTWWLLRVPIDHVFVSDGLTPLARTIGPNAGSDHAPVIVDLAPTA